MIARVTDQVKDEAWRLPPAVRAAPSARRPSRVPAVPCRRAPSAGSRWSFRTGLRDHDRVFLSQVQILLGHPAFSGL